ncbi:MAG: macro domain-containing protein, partial [Chloroflexota bacterium]
MNKPDFKLILVDIDKNLCTVLEKRFAGLPEVEIVHGYFESLPAFDCMVSAANSFGIMDGGVDAAITRFFGVQLMKRVQQHILEHYYGEQPVGTSFIIETGSKKYPFLAHTPTMRVPMDIRNTDNVYLAMWAMLREVAAHNKVHDWKINAVACPGLGTGYGRMTVDQAARQMSLAYHNFLNPPTGISSIYATTRQESIGFGGYKHFS